MANANGFLKLNRSKDLEWLMETRPSAFLLLTQIATRARYDNTNHSDGLEIGESRIGDHKRYGVTRHTYRKDINFLQENHLATFRTNGFGTIGKLVDTTIFDINAPKEKPQVLMNLTTNNKQEEVIAKDNSQDIKSYIHSNTTNSLADSKEYYKAKLDELKKKHKILDIARRLDIKFFHGNNAGTVAIKCFEHEDKHASLVLMPLPNRYECKGCGAKGDVIDFVQKFLKIKFTEAIKWLEPNYYDYARINKPTDGNSYLSSRKITASTIEQFRLRVEPNFVAIPLPNGGEKRRMFVGENKFSQAPGFGSCLFKSPEDPEQKVVYLCEGEMDVIKLWQETGYQSWTGTSGALSFRSEWAKDFEDIQKVFICYDTDEVGCKGAQAVADMIGPDKCFYLKLPSGCKDITEYFLLGNTKEDFDKLVAEARLVGKAGESA